MWPEPAGRRCGANKPGYQPFGQGDVGRNACMRIVLGLRNGRRRPKRRERGGGQDRQSHWCKPKPVNKPGSRSEARSRGDGSADPDQKIPETLGLGPRSRMSRCRGPTSRRQLGPIQTLSCFSEAGIPALRAGRCRKKRAVEMWWGCAVAFEGAGEGSGDAAKTDNRIGVVPSPFRSLVPDPKRDLVVTARADPD